MEKVLSFLVGSIITVIVVFLGIIILGNLGQVAETQKSERIIEIGIDSLAIILAIPVGTFFIIFLFGEFSGGKA